MLHRVKKERKKEEASRKGETLEENTVLLSLWKTQIPTALNKHPEAIQELQVVFAREMYWCSTWKQPETEN